MCRFLCELCEEGAKLLHCITLIYVPSVEGNHDKFDSLTNFDEFLVLRDAIGSVPLFACSTPFCN